MVIDGIRGVTVDLHEEVVAELEKRAASMDFFLDEYCASVLANWAKSDAKLSLTEE